MAIDKQASLRWRRCFRDVFKTTRNLIGGCLPWNERYYRLTYRSIPAICWS
jgi:hypothetical protein